MSVSTFVEEFNREKARADKAEAERDGVTVELMEERNAHGRAEAERDRLREALRDRLGCGCGEILCAACSEAWTLAAGEEKK